LQDAGIKVCAWIIGADSLAGGLLTIEVEDKRARVAGVQDRPL